MTYSEKTITNHIVKLSKKLMAIESTENNPQALHEVLNIARKELEGYFAMEEFESNGIPSLLVHNTNKRTKHFKIILNAHLDVVPGKKSQFKPYEKDGKLYGRGAYDMKATAAVMIILFKNLAKDINYPFALQIVNDEEVYSEHTTQYQIQKGIRGDFIISGESSSNLNLKTQAKGGLWLDIQANGRTAHGGYPWRGDNALWKLTDALQKLQRSYPVPDKEVWETTINLAKIDTPNTATNAVPDKANALLDVRFIHEEKDSIVDKIRSILPNEISMSVVMNTLPTYISNDNPYVQLLQKATKQRVPDAGEIQKTHATSDIRFYNEVGCVGIEYGPRGGKQHSDGEWVDIKSLEDYYYILKDFLLSAKELA